MHRDYNYYILYCLCGKCYLQNQYLGTDPLHKVFDFRLIIVSVIINWRRKHVGFHMHICTKRKTHSHCTYVYWEYRFWYVAVL